MIAKNDFFQSTYLKMHIELTSNINQNQKLDLKDLSKLFAVCTSWRIPGHHSDRIFDCHPTRIFESFRGTI